MRRLLVVAWMAVGLGAAAIWAQQPVKIVTSTGTDVPVATTTELTHGATAPTWTAVVGLVNMARGSAAAPTAVTANQPVAPWANLAGARAAFLVDGGTNALIGGDAAGGLKVQVTATSQGAVPGYYISAASNNATIIKNSAGNVYTFSVINTTASLKYIRFYDVASGPTCTSATGIVFYSPIPASTTNPVPLTWAAPVGKGFQTGIGFCLTGAAGTTDNTSTAAGDVIVNYDYK